MLTYRICPHKSPHKVVTGKDYLNKEHILARQLDRCKIKVGDKVRCRGAGTPVEGRVSAIIMDHTQCEWKKNHTQPHFIRVAIPLTVEIDGATVYMGFQSQDFPLKQVRFIK